MFESKLSGLIFLVLLVGTFWMLWPVLGALLLGIFTAYVFRYLEKRLKKAFESHIVASSVLVAILILAAVLIVLGSTASLSVLEQDYNAFLEAISGSARFLIEVFELPESFSAVADAIVTDIGQGLKDFAFSSIKDLPSLAINAFIFLTSAIYFFAEGEKASNTLFHMADKLEARSGEILMVSIRSIRDFFEAVFLTRAVTAIVTFIIAGIGFYILNVGFWWGWGILTAIFVFLPILGAYLMYLPLGFILMAVEGFWTGMAVILYGILVISTLPHYLVRPYVSELRADENLFILFLGFVAGPLVMGLKGLFIGPSVLVLARDLFDHVYRREEDD